MQHLLKRDCQVRKSRKMRPLSAIIASFIIVIVISLSCEKDDYINNNSFHGRWKTSYGDTIVFATENGKNIITYNLSMNTTLPVQSKKEFIYRHGKLGILDGLNGPDFHLFQSFKWTETGKSFEVQGVEWFPFISSTMTYFTFTKI